MSARIEIKDCFKTYTLDQDKALSPEETVARVKKNLAAAGLDVLRGTERIDNGRMDIPVYVSICGKDALQVMPTRKQMGKGATPAQAEASAVMEMVERFSFFHFVNRQAMEEAELDDVSDRAMPFEHLAASVHHNPEDLERARRAMAGLPLKWTPAKNLTRNSECLVPLTWFFEINEFNGPAAGNTIEEAIVQGLSELVERHVCALISRGKLVTPTIDPGSLKSPVARELVEKFQRQGIELYIKDFTLDMGIPTVGALAWDPATFPGDSEIVYTAGTAPDPEKALIRALTEVAQLGGDFNTRSNFLASGLPKHTAVAQTEYIRQGPVISIDTLPDLSSDNIRTEIESMVEVLGGRGFEVYVINATHPALDIPAVYTIMPGAHFRERARGSSVPFFAAKLLTAAGDPHRTLAGLEHLRSLYPGSYFLNFYEAETLLDLGMADRAAELLEAALDMNPPEEDRAGILTYLGLALKEMEQYEKAAEYLTQSALIDDERRDTFNLLGFCCFKTKRHREAIEAFQKVLRIDPGSGIDYANIGVNYRELGQPAEAIRYFRTALELDPTLEWVWDNLAKLSGGSSED